MFDPRKYAPLLAAFESDNLSAGGVASWADRYNANTTWVQASGPYQPVVHTGGVNGLPLVRFAGGQYLTSAYSGRLGRLVAGGGFSIVYAISMTVPGSASMLFGQLTSLFGALYYGGGGFGPYLGGGGFNNANVPSNTFCLIGVTFDPIVDNLETSAQPTWLVRVYLNGACVCSSAATSAQMGTAGTTDLITGTLNGTGGSWQLNADIYSQYFYERPMSPAQMYACHRDLMTKYGSVLPAETASETLLFVGDSVCAGYRATCGQDYPSQVGALRGMPLGTVWNFGVSGQTMESMERMLPSDIAGLLSVLKTRPTMIGPYDWYNSRVNSGVSEPNIYAHMTALLASWRAAGGGKTLVLTPMADGATSATERAALAASVNANYASYANGVVDLNADTNVGGTWPPAGTGALVYTNLFYDTIHMKSAGYAYVAGVINTALTALPAGPALNTYTVTPPTPAALTPGVASSNFTISAPAGQCIPSTSSNITVAITCTGGTVSPASVTLTPAGTSGTFAVTPSGTGNVTLAFSANAPGVADAPSMTIGTTASAAAAQLAADVATVASHPEWIARGKSVLTVTGSAPAGSGSSIHPWIL